MIAIGSDHRGYKIKQTIIQYFTEQKIEYKDYGTNSEERMDYPIIAKAVAESVQNGNCELGILICGTGFGMSIVANKYKGIRCAPCCNEETARLAKEHNNSNILALGADELSNEKAIQIIKTWFCAKFEGERHKDRLEMIEKIEEENMK